MRFIGDIHGKFKEYRVIAEGADASIQVGDYGAGYRTEDGAKFDDVARAWQWEHPQHRFIRGNHDNPEECELMRNWIPDGTIEVTDAGTKIMYIGGARSIDSARNIPGVSWWPNEECSIYMLECFINDAASEQPDVIVTHDCPASVATKLFFAKSRKFRSPDEKSRTREALEALFEAHQPKLWVFGHWHFFAESVINGTQFVCLPELAYMDIDL
jgi:predicted phosphodiesterase